MPPVMEWLAVAFIVGLPAIERVTVGDRQAAREQGSHMVMHCQTHRHAGHYTSLFHFPTVYSA